MRIFCPATGRLRPSRLHAADGQAGVLLHPHPAPPPAVGRVALVSCVTDPDPCACCGGRPAQGPGRSGLLVRCGRTPALINQSGDAIQESTCDAPRQPARATGLSCQRPAPAPNSATMRSETRGGGAVQRFWGAVPLTAHRSLPSVTCPDQVPVAGEPL